MVSDGVPRGGDPCKAPRPGCPESVSGPDYYVAYGFVFLGSIVICRLYKLTLSDQVTLYRTASLSSLVLRLLAGPPLLEVQRFFSPGPKPALGGLDRR